MNSPGEWVTRGFEAFRRGRFGNAGQNLYVSRAGVLQRIHLFDLNQDGWLDLVFCNSQAFWEAPPAYVYSDALGQARRLVKMRSDGAVTGAVGDLNGDGRDELVLGMESNGIRNDLNAFVYYGSPGGLTERYHVEIPAPRCSAAAIGDFNGDGKEDLAFLCGGKVRIFYQNELGFEPLRFIEPGIEAEDLAAADLDGDGCAELVVRRANAAPVIFWGGRDGIQPARSTALPSVNGIADMGYAEGGQASAEERRATVKVLARIVRLDGMPHIFLASLERAALVPVKKDRSFGAPLLFECPRALAVAAGDINGDGVADLAFACRDERDGRQFSYVYWGDAAGFSETRRTALPSLNACDVAIGDLDGDGCAEVVFCQNRTLESHSCDSLIYRGGRDGVATEPVFSPAGEGARRVFIARTSDEKLPQLIFVNSRSGLACGDTDPVIYWGAADGFSVQRRSSVKGFGATNSIGCDVNDDGRPDLVVVNCAENAVNLDPGSFVFLGSPSGFAARPDLIVPTRRAMGACVGDIDRDGYLDLIFSMYGGPDLLIFHGSTNGFDLEHPQRIRLIEDGVEYTEGRRPLLADLNNDGWLDLVVTDNARDRCFVLWGGPDGFDFARRQTLSVVRASTPQAADLTGSGYLDLIIGGHKPDKAGPHDSFVYIYWNGPDGLRSDRRTQLPANGVVGLAIADFNNDGFLDIFAGSYVSARERDIDSFIYWNGPGGDFSATRCTRIRTHSVSGCIAADFNEDGWTDLAIVNHKTYGNHIGDSFVLWNGPNGFDAGRPTRLPTIGAHGLMAVGPGNQSDRGPEEYYLSEPFELPGDAEVRNIGWKAELPPKTWVRAQMRRAAGRAELERAPWQGRAGGNGWLESGDAVPALRGPGRWVQYRLALGAVNSGNTPRVSEVRVSYE